MQPSSAGPKPPTCAGPDPNPQRPRIAIPAGGCDCHAHVFGPAERYPYDPKRAYTPPDAPTTHYLSMLDAVGLTRGVLVQPSVYGTDNRCLLAALGAAPQRLRGVVVVDPRAANTTQLEAWTRRGVCGVRFNLVVSGGLPLQHLESIAERLAEIGWHLDLIVDQVERLAALEECLRRLPCDVVIEQMGRIKGGQPMTVPGFQALLRLLRDGKAWVKLSHAYHISSAGLPYADTTVFARQLVEAAPECVVWGSDWPHPMVQGVMPNDGDLLELVGEWVPDPRQRKAVLCDNPAKLYGFPPIDQV